MTNPIKLTDKIINAIVLHPDLRAAPGSADLQHAIRTLRDRARAVVGSSGEPFLNRIGKRIAVDAEYIEALREVLP